MTDLRKAAEMALEALESAQNGMNECYEETGFDFANEQYEVEQATQALRQALAQPKYQTVSAPQPQTFTGQKPALWLVQYTDHHEFIWGEKPKFMGSSLLGIEPLYTAPPKHKWVGLTEKEFQEVTKGLEDLEDCWVAIEAKLKEKNT